MSNSAHCIKFLQLSGKYETNFAALLATVTLGGVALTAVSSLENIGCFLFFFVFSLPFSEFWFRVLE